MAPRSAALAAIVISLVLCLGWYRGNGTVEKSGLAPMVGGPPGPGQEVVWVFRARDFLACETAAGALRRAVARDDAPKVRLIVVGEDDGLAEGFLRTERLTAQLIRISERGYRRRFSGTPLPVLYVASSGRVTAWWAGVEPVRTATTGEYPPLLERLGEE